MAVRWGKWGRVAGAGKGEGACNQAAKHMAWGSCLGIMPGCSREHQYVPGCKALFLDCCVAYTTPQLSSQPHPPSPLHRRQSQGFSRGTSSYRGVTHHPSGRWEARIGGCRRGRWKGAGGWGQGFAVRRSGHVETVLSTVCMRNMLALHPHIGRRCAGLQARVPGPVQRGEGEGMCCLVALFGSPPSFWIAQLEASLVSSSSSVTSVYTA